MGACKMSFLSVTGTVILSMSPIFEVRGAIPFAAAMGMNIWLAFLLAMISNIVLIPLVFLFLDYIHIHLMKLGVYSRAFNLYLGNVRGKAEKKVIGSVWPYFALFGFIALPLPGTGVWTGVLISWFFEMNRKKSFISIALGSICVSLITVLITLGVVKIW